MKRHLTEEELIRHKFGLASDEQVEGAAEHLAGCAECRRRLELLDQKFASLDLLREDVSASNELISQTITQAKQPVRRKTIPLGKYHWIGTAAAVLILGLVFLIDNPNERQDKRRELPGEHDSEQIDNYGRPGVKSEDKERQELKLAAKNLADESAAQLEGAKVERQAASKTAPAPSATQTDANADPRSYAFAPTRGRGSASKKTNGTSMLSAAAEREPELMDRTKSAFAKKPVDEKLAAGGGTAFN